MKKSLITLSLLVALTAQAHDNHKHDDHDDKVEHIGAHVHGIAELNVVLDGDELKVELDTPAMNVVGFEHKPETETHINESHEAIHTLKDGEWLVISGGDCQLEDKDVDWEYLPILHDNDYDHKDHQHADGETHSDIESEHEFECKKPSKVKSITVNLFNDFKGFEKLNVQWIVNDKQGATTLTKDNRVLKLQ